MTPNNQDISSEIFDISPEDLTDLRLEYKNASRSSFELALALLQFSFRAERNTLGPLFGAAEIAFQVYDANSTSELVDQVRKRWLYYLTIDEVKAGDAEPELVPIPSNYSDFGGAVLALKTKHGYGAETSLEEGKAACLKLENGFQHVAGSGYRLIQFDLTRFYPESQSLRFYPIFNLSEVFCTFLKNGKAILIQLGSND